MLVSVELTMSPWHNRATLCVTTSVSDKSEFQVLRQNLIDFVQSKNGQATNFFKLGELGMDCLPKYGQSSTNNLLLALKKATGHEFTIKGNKDEDTVWISLHMGNSQPVTISSMGVTESL